MKDLDTYEIDLLAVIKEIEKGGNHASESNILRRLFPKYKMYATMFFNDGINSLKSTGKVVEMYSGGIRWWESD